MNPHDDLSLENMRAFLASAVIAAAVALGFMGALFWTLSATTSSPSLIGTGANAPLGDTAPVPYVSPEERVDA